MASFRLLRAEDGNVCYIQLDPRTHQYEHDFILDYMFIIDKMAYRCINCYVFYPLPDWLEFLKMKE